MYFHCGRHKLQVQNLTRLQAQMHGNEPSKGAKIDAEIQEEEEQRIREKEGK